MLKTHHAIIDYPPWAEVAVWITRSVSYLFAALTGLAALVLTPLALKSESYVIVGSMLVFGLVCLYSSLTRHYIIEWISLFFLTGGISLYVASVWATTLEKPTAIAGASVFTVLVLLMGVRLIDLTVFWMQNVMTARVRQSEALNDD